MMPDSTTNMRGPKEVRSSVPICENLDSEPCRLETRTKALEHDGLPPETTFVWDLVTDRLVAIFEAGKSTAAGQDRYAGLVRQYIHGDQGYDDPVEVIAADYPRSLTPVRYLPIIDQAGGGSVSAVMNDRGDLVERTLYGDAYGAAPRYLYGAVADAMDLDATKDADGNVLRVTWKVHFSEKLRANSIADGFGVAALDENSVVLIELKPEVTIDDKDPYAALVTLNGAQWIQIRSNANVANVRVSVTDELRVLGWGESPVMELPEWLRPLVGVNSAPHAPVVKQESLGSLQGFLDTVSSGTSGTKPLWSIPDLYLAANDQSKTNVLTGFKAAPFVEPGTGLVYLRTRWYDPSTGTWLSPDPAGYQDSSNLYAFAKNDPVNNSDPTGEAVPLLAAGAAYLGWTFLNTAIDGGIERLIMGDEFDVNASIGSNLLINAATGGLGKLKYLKHAPRLTRFGAQFGVDVGVTGLTTMWAYDRTANEAFGSAAAGHLIGRGVGYGLSRGGRYLRDNFQLVRVREPGSVLGGGLIPGGIQSLDEYKIVRRSPGSLNENVTPFPWRPQDEGIPDAELARQIQALRIQEGVMNKAGMGRNAAAVKLRVDGQVEFMARLNTGNGGPHSEELLAAAVDELRTQGRSVDVLELLSERTPCNFVGGCRPMIAARMPGVRVFGLTRETGALARRQLARLYGF